MFPEHGAVRGDPAKSQIFTDLSKGSSGRPEQLQWMGQSTTEDRIAQREHSKDYLSIPSYSAK